jgi:predicted RNase H-like HicB family nuclease
MTLECLLWHEEGLWTAHAPAMRGCYGVGRTKQAALTDLKSAVAEMTAYHRELGGKQIKRRRSEIVKIDVGAV